MKMSTFDLRHPKNKLGELAGNRTVRYDLEWQDDELCYSCKVMVDSVEVAVVMNGSSRDDATEQQMRQLGGYRRLPGGGGKN